MFGKVLTNCTIMSTAKIINWYGGIKFSSKQDFDNWASDKHESQGFVVSWLYFKKLNWYLILFILHWRRCIYSLAQPHRVRENIQNGNRLSLISAWGR